MLINAVAPFAGAWIEMAFVDDEQQKAQVAPFAGAWIEILKLLCICWVPLPSLPSRERGLKYGLSIALLKPIIVAPFAGAWIEILFAL